MQRWGAVRLVLTGLLAGGLIASGATSVARPHKPPKATLTARVAPGTVSVGEPATLAVRLRPAARGVRLVVQRRAGSRWVTMARPRTDADGTARIRLPTAVVGEQRFRVLRKSARRDQRATSPVVSLNVSTSAPRCTPRPALVDPQAGPAARCLAARLDRWRAAGAMGVGQQLNVSTSAHDAPLTVLGDRAVPVVGFDLEELFASQDYGFPIAPVDALIAKARAGAVLSMSWHPANPGSGGAYSDRGWHDLGALVAHPESAAYQSFWAAYDARLSLLQQLDAAGVAVVFRPLHEANGDWFWWGHPDPALYRKLWSLLQQRAWAAGVHNLLWAYSFNAATGDHIGDPVRLLPAKVDLAGMDSYDDESTTPADQLPVGGYDAVAAKVKRMAITEVGPHDSPDGAWDPAVISRTARTLPTPPLWSMLWFDDAVGRKQIGSLQRGRRWLDSCRDGSAPSGSDRSPGPRPQVTCAGFDRGMTTRIILGALGAALTVPLIAIAPVQAHDHRHGHDHGTGHGHHAAPQVFGHRGASGYRPEHTLASYRLAIELGADYVEPDLVSTKDGVLVARHENEIGGTTDVAAHAEFASRRTAKTIDGRSVTGWFTEDFTLAELKTLRAKERLPQVRPENTAYDGRFEIPTFAEVLRLVQREERRTGRTIGVAPETKHPTYFDSIGLSLEEPMLRTLDRFGLDSKRDKVVIQSFEIGNLRQLARMTRLPLEQLVDAAGGPADQPGTTYAAMVTPSGLRSISRYADWVGPNKDLVLPRDPATGATGAPSALVDDAHRVGLKVVVFTLRNENQFMATNFRIGTDPNADGDIHAEITAFLGAGVDGLFADYPDVAVAARNDWLG